MAPPLTSLYTLSFFLALAITIFVAASLRLLAILPPKHFQSSKLVGKRSSAPHATRVLVVLGSGGHTHEMFYLLRDLDTRKYTHRTYVVSSGDAFSAGRAVEFEREIEEREAKRRKERGKDGRAAERDEKREIKPRESRPPCVGSDHYNIATIPRARKIHQSLLTTPFTSLTTLISSFTPLLSSPPLLPGQPPQSAYEAAAQDLPDMIITNGPATAVIMVLAVMILRFFNVRGANSRGKCKTVYVESFARVTTLSLSGRLLLRVVDRFLVQWKELEGKGGRAEYWGVLV